MRHLLLCLLALPLFSQVPKPAPIVFDEAFFSGDRRSILEGCADRVRSIKSKDTRYLAEKDAVDLAEVGLVNESERYMNVLVALEKDDWERFLMFGQALLVSGRCKKAAASFARAAALKPDEEKLFLQISRAFAETQSVM